jgi:hypothetical protein
MTTERQLLVGEETSATETRRRIALATFTELMKAYKRMKLKVNK